MNTDTARDDLAFMRSLIDDNGKSQMAFGIVYLGGGLIYATQLAINWAQWVGKLTLTDGQTSALIMGASLAFGALVTLANIKYRTATANLATRAFGSAFSGVAVTAVTLCAVFALYATRIGPTAWLMFVPVAFALQGGGWFAAFVNRRRAWQLLVALGWLGSALLCGWIGERPVVALVYAATFLTCMAVPGAAMIRLASRQA